MGDRVAVMRKGVLQQVEPPQVLYNRPRNLFVAGFVGSPAMNLAEASVSRSDAGVFVEFGHARLRVDEKGLDARPALARYAGRSVILGVRPEDMEDAALGPEAPTDRRMPVLVELREELGSHATIHFEVDTPSVLTDEIRELVDDLGTGVGRIEKQSTSNFVAQLDGRSRAREGDRIDLLVDTARLHFFDPDSGLGIYDD